MIRRLKRMVLKLAPAAAVFLFLVLLVFLARSNLFQVRQVSCQEEFGSCSGEVVGQLKALEGRNIFFLGEKDLADRVLAVNHEIRSLRFSRRLPDTVLVQVERRKGVNALANYVAEEIDFSILTATTAAKLKIPQNSQPGFFLLDKEGAVFLLVDDSPLPSVFIPQESISLVVGQMFDLPEAQAAAKIARLLLLPAHRPVVVSPQGQIFANLEEEILAIFSDKKDPSFQVATLQLILARARIEGKIPQRVDLRFDKPVVIY